jgi:hypothetical protein
VRMHTTVKTLRRSCMAAITLVLALTLPALTAHAASWNGIEPLRTRRDEVIKILGAPTGESPDGVMRFNVQGGSVQVSFVNDQFVKAKKLRADLAGTVLEVVLQHEHSSDTPETLKLASNHSFVRDEQKGTLVFRNMKEGLIYTFINGLLRTTRYTFADDQLNKARR